MIRAFPLVVVALLVVALGATVRVEEARVAGARQRAAVAALHAANAVAERDRTREIGEENGRAARLLGDSLRLVERLVVQRTQARDALDRALRRERVARYQVALGVNSLERAVRGEPVVDEVRSERRARFAVRQAPYTIAADVVMLEPPDSGSLSIRVALDPLHLEARVGCAAPDADGIRAASLSATGPSWATVRFDRVEQSEALCASPALTRSESRRSRVAMTPLVLGAGRVFDGRGRGTWGVFVGVGYAVRL